MRGIVLAGIGVTLFLFAVVAFACLNMSDGD